MKNNINNQCRTCGETDAIKSFYPDVHFNNKVFSYYKCNSCKSFNLFPTPNEDDFKEMYGGNDHTYLKELKGELEYDFNYPFGDHQGYQVQFLSQIKEDLKEKKLLDYACGSGFYMKYAEQLGAKVIGVEFDLEFVNLLKEKTNFEIFTFTQLKEKFIDDKFDYIHLGHVLEHVPNPYQLIIDLKKMAHKSTVFLIDGPLDRNYCLHRFYVDFGSKLKAKKYSSTIPQHISLTTHKSQLTFFSRVGLKKNKYIVEEVYFPLPSKIGGSFSQILSYLIATISILISRVVPTSGNIFHYRGRIDEM